MFLRAGALSLLLLVASRLLGLLRESAQAAAFGASGLGDVAVLMLSLPDWITGVLAAGALGYVLLPAWAGRSEAQIAISQRLVARVMLAGGLVLGGLLILARDAVIDALLPGLGAQLRPAARTALLWSALALAPALLAAVWATRLQHEGDVPGMYGANLVVNVAVLLSLTAVGLWLADVHAALGWLGVGLVGAMLLRLGWLFRRQATWRAPRPDASASSEVRLSMATWGWAVLAAGLPLVLPFTVRSAASASGEGVLATFNYAWKLVELPLLLAVQLVATIAFPGIARACSVEGGTQAESLRSAVRPALALAWVLACAAVAALLVGAPALAQLLFGWGRMQPEALRDIADWGRTGAWGLLPQAFCAVVVTVLAAQRRLHVAVIAYGAALLGLGAAAAFGLHGGSAWMACLNALFGVAAVLVALGWGASALRACVPWSSLVAAGGAAPAVAAMARMAGSEGWGMGMQLAAAVAAAGLVLAVGTVASHDLRVALRR